MFYLDYILTAKYNVQLFGYSIMFNNRIRWNSLMVDCNLFPIQISLKF